MSAITKVIRKLAKYPDVTYEREANRICVPAQCENGFEVWLCEEIDGFEVGYDGWHEHFDNEDEAVECFGFGLSEYCRLEVTLRDKTPCKWKLQYRDGDEWVTESTVGLVFVAFWRRKRTVLLQNQVIRST